MMERRSYMGDKITATVKAAERETAAAASAAEAVVEPVERQEEVKAVEKEPEKKTATRKRRTSKKAAETVEKEETKPAARRGRTPKSAKPVISLQFAGKSYSMEDIQKMADEVWRTGLEKGKEPYKSLELYVKPEENTVYYVFNGEIMGSFSI